MKLAHATRPLILALAVGCCAASALAQPRDASQTSALINQQLDQRIAFKLNSSPLPQVLQSIEEKTGVPIRVTDDVYDILPWGTQTPITADVENLSLRDALTAMLGKLGLKMELRDQYLELSPVPALRRVGRRATLQELQTLDVLSHRATGVPASSPTLADLAHAIDQRLAGPTTQSANAAPATDIVVELRPSDEVDPTKVTVMLARDSTLADALDAVANQTKMTWYPWGDSIVILSKRAVVRSMLERRVSLRYDGVDVAQVLTDLANRTGVAFSIEPGAIQRVTPEFRIIKLTADATVRQALESLQGYTGLGYIINDDGVYIWNQNSTPTNGASRGKVIAQVQIAPNTSIFLREEDVTPATRDAIEAQRRQAAAALDKQFATTQPTTRDEPASN